jgi:hypothetical protein
VADDSTQARLTAAQLLAQLARELSTLVRRDVEVAAAERLPTLRRALLDVGAITTVGVAIVFVLGAASVATGRAFAAVMPGWAAALVVGGIWTGIAAIACGILLRPWAQPHEREKVVGLVQMLSNTQRLENLQSEREDARDEAEAEMRETAARLVKAFLDEAAEHQVRAAPAVARRELAKAEPAAAEAVAEALALLTAPARAGLGALGRLIEPRAPARRATAADERARRS